LVVLRPKLDLQLRRSAGDSPDGLKHVARLGFFCLFQDAPLKTEDLERRHADTTNGKHETARRQERCAPAASSKSVATRLTHRLDFRD